MKCIKCKLNIPDGSAFCNHCGAAQKKERKATHAIKVPTPRLLPSGSWFIQLRSEGQSVTDPDRETCISKARAIRAGWVAATGTRNTLSAAIDKYISERQAVLSPSTIRGYRLIQTGRFQNMMNKPLSADSNWQLAINKEAEIASPHTVRNAWGLVTAVMKSCNITPPRVRLPQKIQKQTAWLTYEDIPRFIQAIEGDSAEIAILLALHSLRLSELLALKWKNVSPNNIKVSGAKVRDESGSIVYKESNKTSFSARTMPIMIPRLKVLLEEQKGTPETFVVSVHPSTIRLHIRKTCESLGMPNVGIHGLRHSFASLGYHLGMSESEIMEIGGWDDYTTVRNIYRHLAMSDKKAASNKMAAFYKKNNE